MKALVDSGLCRELQAILTVYTCSLLSGYSLGFSAVAIPDIKSNMRQYAILLYMYLYIQYTQQNEDFLDLEMILITLFPELQLQMNNYHGLVSQDKVKNNFLKIIIVFFSQCCQYWRNIWLPVRRLHGSNIWPQEDDADVLSGDGAGLALYCCVSPHFTANHWQIHLWSWECNGNVNHIFTCGTIQVS